MAASVMKAKVPQAGGRLEGVFHCSRIHADQETSGCNPILRRETSEMQPFPTSVWATMGG